MNAIKMNWNAIVDLIAEDKGISKAEAVNEVLHVLASDECQQEFERYGGLSFTIEDPKLKAATESAGIVFNKN